MNVNIYVYYRTLSRRKTGHLLFHRNFGKCEKMYEILSPEDL